MTIADMLYWYCSNEKRINETSSLESGKPNRFQIRGDLFLSLDLFRNLLGMFFGHVPRCNLLGIFFGHTPRHEEGSLIESSFGCGCVLVALHLTIVLESKLRMPAASKAECATDFVQPA